MDVHHVEPDTHGRYQVEECFFAEELPAEHPVGTVGKPACVIEREGCHIISASVCCCHGFARAFRSLRYHEVEINPCHELLVLGTDIEMETGVDGTIKFFVFQSCSWVIEGCVRARAFECTCYKSGIVDIFLESGHHATDIGTEGNETADVVLVIETGVGSGRMGRKRKNAEHHCHA